MKERITGVMHADILPFVNEPNLRVSAVKHLPGGMTRDQKDLSFCCVVVLIIMIPMALNHSQRIFRKLRKSVVKIGPVVSATYVEVTEWFIRMV